MKHFLVMTTLAAMLVSPASAKPYLDIQEITTKTGIHVWAVNDETIPVLSVKFSFKGGAQLDALGKEGTAELLSTLLDEGAEKRDSEAFQDTLDAHGIRLGFSAGRDSFTGSMKTTIEHQDLAFVLLGDALNRPLFADDAVARMKEALLSQQRFLHMDPDWVASQAMFDALFPGQPYARPVEGTVETLKKITVQDIRDFKTRLMCRERLKIAVVGKIDANDLAQRMDRVFGGLPSCTEDIDTDILPLQAKGKTITKGWQGAQSVMMMVQEGLSRQDKDWWAARILDFALGGGQFSSRLMDEVRVKRGLTYGIYSMVAPYDRAPLWIVQASVDPAKIDEAIKVTKDIWADVAAKGLTDAEIAEAKSYLIGSLPLALTSTDKMAAIVLQLQEDKLPKNTLDMRADEINAVTSEDIRRVAKTRLHTDHLTTIIVGPVSKKVSEKR